MPKDQPVGCDTPILSVFLVNKFRSRADIRYMTAHPYPSAADCAFIELLLAPYARARSAP